MNNRLDKENIELSNKVIDEDAVERDNVVASEIEDNVRTNVGNSVRNSPKDDKAKRILIKVSGEFISVGSYKSQFDVYALINSIKTLLKDNYKICIVIGGGNICRGRDLYDQEIKKTWQIDKIGMLSTMINANILSSLLGNHQVENKILSSIVMPQFFETYTYHVAEEYLLQNKVLIFAGGTAMSGVSTDTLAVTRAIEMNVSKVIKVTTIDGVYDSDPAINSGAKRINKISYDELLSNQLKVIDFSAASIAGNNKIKLYITNKYDRLNEVLVNDSLSSQLF